MPTAITIERKRAGLRSTYSLSSKAHAFGSNSTSRGIRFPAHTDKAYVPVRKIPSRPRIPLGRIGTALPLKDSRRLPILDTCPAKRSRCSPRRAETHLPS